MRGMQFIIATIATATLYQIFMTPVRADLLDKQRQALGIIASTADSICTSVAKKRTASDDVVSNITANLLDQASTVIGGLNIGAKQITGEVRDAVKNRAIEFASTESVDCKQSIAGMLVPIMVPSIAAPSPAPAANVVLVPRKSDHPPSVNCSHTTEPLELLLCADDELAVWDGTMGSIYWAKVHERAPGDQIQLRRDQISWQQKRDAACDYNPFGSYSFNDLLLKKPCFLQQTIQRVTQLGSS
jgi:uncharacterized protein YecT (DUF1311 family)/uncharacterized membrane protein